MSDEVAAADHQHFKLGKFDDLLVSRCVDCEKWGADQVQDHVDHRTCHRGQERIGGFLLGNIQAAQEGNQIEEGKKSVAYSLTLRSSEGTLAEEQITAMMDKIVKMLGEKLGASLR